MVNPVIMAGSLGCFMAESRFYLVVDQIKTSSLFLMMIFVKYNKICYNNIKYTHSIFFMKKIIITTLLAPFVLSACSDGITIHPEEIDDVVNHIADFTDKTENGEGIPMDDLIDFADAFNEATGQYDIYNSWGEEPSAYLQELAEAAFKLPYTMELERTGDEDIYPVTVSIENYPEYGHRQVVNQPADGERYMVEVVTEDNFFLGGGYARVDGEWFTRDNYNNVNNALELNLLDMASYFYEDEAVLEEIGDSAHNCGNGTCTEFTIEFGYDSHSGYKTTGIKSYHFDKKAGRLYKVSAQSFGYEDNYVTEEVYNYDVTQAPFELPSEEPTETINDFLGFGF